MKRRSERVLGEKDVKAETRNALAFVFAIGAFTTSCESLGIQKIPPERAQETTAEERLLLSFISGAAALSPNNTPRQAAVWGLISDTAQASAVIQVQNEAARQGQTVNNVYNAQNQDTPTRPFVFPKTGIIKVIQGAWLDNGDEKLNLQELSEQRLFVPSRDVTFGIFNDTDKTYTMKYEIFNRETKEVCYKGDFTISPVDDGQTVASRSMVIQARSLKPGTYTSRWTITDTFDATHHFKLFE